MSNTRLKIAEFANLKHGWCHGEGLPIKKQAIHRAEELFLFFIEKGIRKTNAFPCINGGAMVTGYLDNHYIEFTLEDDESVTYYYELNDEWTDYFDYLTLEQAKECATKKIAEIKNENGLWQKSLGYSAKNTTGMRTKNVSKVPHSKHQTSQYFSANALLMKVVACVVTPKDSIAPSLTRQFVGNSMQNYYPITAR
jgi:hypothetical protein